MPASTANVNEIAADLFKGFTVDLVQIFCHFSLALSFEWKTKEDK